jgi:uncharacterized protein with HEPN domain
MRRDKFQIEEIVDEIEEINQFLEAEKCHNLNNFLSNNLLKKGVMMSIINIEEHTKHLSNHFLYQNPNINFDQFREIRNIAAHKYGTINFVLIWNIIKNTLPNFEQQLLSIKFEHFENDVSEG